MGLRYTVRKKGNQTTPGYGQVVTPVPPREGTKYFNPETHKIKKVGPKEKQEKQPPYTRGSANLIQSPRLKALNNCVKTALTGKTFEGKLESLKAMNDASKNCKTLLDMTGVPGGIPVEMQKTFNKTLHPEGQVSTTSP